MVFRATPLQNELARSAEMIENAPNRLRVEI
jgi:hypothetical protein